MRSPTVSETMKSEGMSVRYATSVTDLYNCQFCHFEKKDAYVTHNGMLVCSINSHPTSSLDQLACLLSWNEQEQAAMRALLIVLAI